MNNKIIARVVAICLFVLLLASVAGACGAPAPAPAPKPTPTPAPAPTSAPTPAPAGPIELKLATWVGEGGSESNMFKWWADELNKRGAGKVKTTIFWAGTMGGPAEIVDNIIKGVVDGGMFATALSPGRYPMTDWDSRLFFKNSSMPMDLGIHYYLYDLGLYGEQFDKDFKLCYFGPTEWFTYMGNKKITNLEELKGQKIRLAGATATAFKALGAEPVATSTAEMYGAIEKGVVIGAVTGAAHLKSSKLVEVTKYILLTPLFHTVTYVGLNNTKWNNLPDDVKVIIGKLNLDMRDISLMLMMDYNKKEWFPLLSKVEGYYLSSQEVQRWADITAVVFEDYIKDLNAKGLPGNKLKEAIFKVIEQYPPQYPPKF